MVDIKNYMLQSCLRSSTKLLFKEWPRNNVFTLSLWFHSTFSLLTHYCEYSILVLDSLQYVHCRVLKCCLVHSLTLSTLLKRTAQHGTKPHLALSTTWHATLHNTQHFLVHYTAWQLILSATQTSQLHSSSWHKTLIDTQYYWAYSPT